MDKKQYVYRIRKPDGEFSAPAYSNRSVFLSQGAGTNALKRSPKGSVLLRYTLGEPEVLKTKED